MAYKKLKYWFDIELAILLADKITLVKDDFNRSRFISTIDQNTQDLELKDRVELIADYLYLELGGNYPVCIKVLIKILGPENPNETGMFTDFYWIMPIAKVVEKYGISEFDLSMHALEEITKLNTSEYAIRPYLEKETNKTLIKMEEWSNHPNFHVRRLASEGVRPRLPWAKKLDLFINEPKLLFPILNNLIDDPSKYVQKSVANCINDVLKDNSEIAKEWVEQWNGPKIGIERKWIIKHALRNLLKMGDEWAIRMTP